MIERSCAFTGHRPKKFPWGYNEADVRCIALKKELAGQIIKLVDTGYTDFLSGMAEGADTWAVLAVLALKKENPALRLHCILPCKGQADEWSASARERYFSILEQADDVVYVSREYSKSCMVKRNRYLVDHAACLLAVYNGEWRGGTAMTVRYAQKLGRKIIIIEPPSSNCLCLKIWYNGKNYFYKEPIMMDLEYLKQFREIKDIADIIDEIEKLDCLAYQNDWYAVDQHLQDVSKKHTVEKAVYNSANQVMPQSIQQNAANCRQFLLALGAEKIAKELSKHLGGN